MSIFSANLFPIFRKPFSPRKFEAPNARHKIEKTNQICISQLTPKTLRVFSKMMERSKKEAEEIFVVMTHQVLFDRNMFFKKEHIVERIGENGMLAIMVRYAYNDKFSWPILTNDLVNGIAAFLGDRGCLSVMSGKGILEYFLSRKKCGDIIATDQLGKDCVNGMKSIKLPEYRSLLNNAYDECNWFDVIKCDAIKAVRTYDKEVLLISWPPYTNPIGAKVLKFALELGFKYIIYIGEGDDGCCATDEFFEILASKTEEVKSIEMLRFWGIWDFCTIYKSTISTPALKTEFRSPLLNKKIYSFVYHNASLSNRTLKTHVKEYFGVDLGKKHFNFLRTLF